MALSFLPSLSKVTHETFTHVQSPFQVETKKVLNAEAKFQLLQKITDLKCSTKEATNVLQNGLQQRCFPISQSTEAVALKNSLKRYSSKFRKIHKKTLVPEFSLIKTVRPATSLKKRLWHRCFFVSLAKFL